jgi:hypothetical protein
VGKNWHFLKTNVLKNIIADFRQFPAKFFFLESQCCDPFSSKNAVIGVKIAIFSPIFRRIF